MKIKRMTTATRERRTRPHKRGHGKATIIPRNTEAMQEKSDEDRCNDSRIPGRRTRPHAHGQGKAAIHPT